MFNLCGFLFCYPLFFFLFVCLFILLYFALFFVGFGGLGLPCHLLCCLLLFVFLFFLIYFFFNFFFYLHGFSGFIFCKFNCSWHFFTSSDRVPPGGVGCTGAPFRWLVSRGSKLYKWWFGKASGLIDIELMNMVPRKQLTMGWEDDTWARGSVRLLLPLAGHGWTIWEMVSIALFFFLIFRKSMEIDGWLKVSYSELSVTLRDLFCLLQGAVKAPRLGGEFHSAFWNIIPVTTPIELRRLLMLPRRKERGETSPKILLNCWVGVVKIPLCSDGLENGVKCSKIE